jgi:hypothetical protein
LRELFSIVLIRKWCVIRDDGRRKPGQKVKQAVEQNLAYGLTGLTDL